MKTPSAHYIAGQVQSYEYGRNDKQHFGDLSLRLRVVCANCKTEDNFTFVKLCGTMYAHLPDGCGVGFRFGVIVDLELLL